MRKEAGFEVMDTITIYTQGNSTIEELLKRNEDEVKSEVLATNIVYDKVDGYSKEWNINKEAVTLGVSKN